ncbi:MAG: nucleotide exchange factor GrpE [Leadbetterella sp.]
MAEKKTTSEEKETLQEQDQNTTSETVDPVELEEEDAVIKLEKELGELKDKYLRLYSEFDNFRKRTAKERIDTIMTASEGLMKDLLPVVDDFERAQKSTENATDLTAVKEGIDLIYNKLKNTLTQKGLKPMESIGQTFDVELHECITQFAASDEQKGKIIDEVEKGYFLNEKVIRYAKVVVGN